MADGVVVDVIDRDLKVSVTPNGAIRTAMPHLPSGGSILAVPLKRRFTVEFSQRPNGGGEIGSRCEQVVVIGQDAPGVDRSARRGDRIEEEIAEFGHALHRKFENGGVVQAGGGEEIGSSGARGVRWTVPWMGMLSAPLQQGLLLGIGQSSPQVGH